MRGGTRNPTLVEKENAAVSAKCHCVYGYGLMSQFLKLIRFQVVPSFY